MFLAQKEERPLGSPEEKGMMYLGVKRGQHTDTRACVLKTKKKDNIRKQKESTQSMWQGYTGSIHISLTTHTCAVHVSYDVTRFQKGFTCVCVRARVCVCVCRAPRSTGRAERGAVRPNHTHK